MNLHGFGEAKSAKFMAARDAGLLTDKMRDDVAKAENIFADLFPFRTKYGHLYDDPAGNGLGGELRRIEDFDGTQIGSHLLLGEIIYRNLRDINEDVNVKKRGGKVEKGPQTFIDLRLRDDTGEMLTRITRFDYKAMGEDLFNNIPVGAHLLVRVKMCNGIKFGIIQRWRRIDV